MSQFTAKEKADDAQREVNYRQWVYQRSVAAGRVTQASADRRIAIMREIEAEYRAIAKAEEAEGRLL